MATYAGLLAQAHEEGLKQITTTLVQIPAPENGMVAIVTATVETNRGTFTGIGDASPDNVTRKIVNHIIRMAETRAKARAIRDAVNIGIVALEELGGDDGEENSTPAPAAPPARPSTRPPLRPVGPREVPPPVRAPAEARSGQGQGPRRDDRQGVPMTEPQRRLLYRLLAEQGFEGRAATDALLRAAEVNELRDITKSQASSLIESWKEDANRG
ncbi:MAG: hypothetical protein Q8P41_18550 [Pseudomonadota bacterium]|nr:hypothetical protein [Pseudomonadota bacterium]